MHRHPVGRGPCILRQNRPTCSPHHLRARQGPRDIDLASPGLKFRPNVGGQPRGIGAPPHLGGFKKGLLVPGQGGSGRSQGERFAGGDDFRYNTLEFHPLPQQRRRPTLQHQGSEGLVPSHIPHRAFQGGHLPAVQGHEAVRRTSINPEAVARQAVQPMHLVPLPLPHRKQRVRVHVLVHGEIQFIQPKTVRPLHVSQAILQDRLKGVDATDVGRAVQAVVGLDGDTNSVLHHHRIHAVRRHGHQAALRLKPPRRH